MFHAGLQLHLVAYSGHEARASRALQAGLPRCAQKPSLQSADRSLAGAQRVLSRLQGCHKGTTTGLKALLGLSQPPTALQHFC